MLKRARTTSPMKRLPITIMTPATTAAMTAESTSPPGTAAINGVNFASSSNAIPALVITKMALRQAAIRSDKVRIFPLTNSIHNRRSTSTAFSMAAYAISSGDVNAEIIPRVISDPISRRERSFRISRSRSQIVRMSLSQRPIRDMVPGLRYASRISHAAPPKASMATSETMPPATLPTMRVDASLKMRTRFSFSFRLFHSGSNFLIFPASNCFAASAEPVG